MTIALDTLKDLQRILTSKKPAETDIVSMFDKAPDILQMIPKGYKYDRRTILYFLEKSKSSAYVLGEKSNDKFVQVVCDTYSNPNHKPTESLAKKDINDYLSFGRTLSIDTPIFKITDSTAKDIFKELGTRTNTQLNWANFLHHQIPQQLIKKYWRYDINSLEWLDSKYFTTDMILALIREKPNFISMSLSRVLVGLYADRPDIFTNELLAKGLTEQAILLYHIKQEQFDPATYELAVALAYLTEYKELQHTQDLDNETKVFIDLTQDPEMIRDYLCNKIKRVKRTQFATK